MAGTYSHRVHVPSVTLIPLARLPAALRASAITVTDLDTRLMLEVSAGSRDAAALFIQRNHERVARYISRLIRDRRPVEDLTQEVFLQALRHADHYRPTAKASTWLYRIATNAALNYLKQPAVRRRAAEPGAGTLDVTDPHAPPPDRRLTLDELKERVSQAMVHLPPNQRAALALYEYEGCPYVEIAAVLGISVEAVRCLLSRARSTLRHTLQGLV